MEVEALDSQECWEGGREKRVENDSGAFGFGKEMNPVTIHGDREGMSLVGA